jgi:Tol biopolymer transport system component
MVSASRKMPVTVVEDPLIAAIRLNASHRGVSGDIVLVDLATGKRSVLLSGRRRGAFRGVDFGGGLAWSPDGRFIAFAADLGQRTIHGGVATLTSIYLLRVRNGSLKRLTYGALDDQPEWSADGRKVLFGRETIGNSPPYVTSAIWQVNARGGAPRQVTRPSLGTLDRASALLANGSLLMTRTMVLESSLQDFPTSVLFLRRNGSLMRSISNASTPSLADNDGRLLISTIRDRNGLISTGEDEQAHAAEVYSVALDGGDARRLTATRNISETEPSLSPDGDRILYERQQDLYRRSVWQMKPDGSCQTPILKDTGTISYDDPAWRPGRSLRPPRPLRC